MKAVLLEIISNVPDNVRSLGAAKILVYTLGLFVPAITCTKIH